MKPTDDGLPVSLYGVGIGHLRRVSSNAVQFLTSNEGLSAFGLGSAVLSASIPLASKPSSTDVSTNFFGGLLPEGIGLTNLAKQAGCPSSDVYGLLDYAGRDVAGAVRIGDHDHSNEGYEPISTLEIERRLGRTYDYALGALGGGGSLAGFQPKTTLALIEGQWHAGNGGAASTHILKPFDPQHVLQAHWEAYCLRLARTLRLLEYSAEVEVFGSTTALVIERYDRSIDPHSGRIDRIHQEDAAQGLGLPWNEDAKFESVDSRAALRNIASLLRPVRLLTAAQGDRTRLLKYLTFSVAVGNTDAHAKNFSTLRFADGGIELAPLYDVSAHALAPQGNLNMANRVAKVSYQPSMTIELLSREAISWGIPETVATVTIQRVLEELAAALEICDPAGAGERITAYIRCQVGNLLGGRAAFGGSLPPALSTFE